jgi:hypothetical protein
MVPTLAAVMGGWLLASCGGSSTPIHPSASPRSVAARASVSWQNQPPGKAAGNQVAQELVNAAVLPQGSQRLTKSPTPVLDTPFTTVADETTSSTTTPGGK